jgi:hypothetical protein
MYANDVASYNKLTLPNPLRSRLTSGGRVNENDLLFDGAPRQREPSGAMEASVAEMPIVESVPANLRRCRPAA